jgi:hypothetical protein
MVCRNTLNNSMFSIRKKRTWLQNIDLKTVGVGGIFILLKNLECALSIKIQDISQQPAKANEHSIWYSSGLSKG